MAVKYAAGIGQESVSIDGEDLTAAFGAGSEFALYIPNQGVPYITWQTSFSAAPGSVTILLQASLDGSNWFTIDTSTNVNGEIRTVTGSFRFIRINNSAVTVGAGIDLTASFVQSNGVSIETLDSAGIPIFVEVPITNAQVLASFTTPITIIPAAAGIVNTIKSVSCNKAAGAYGVAGVTNFVIGYAGSSSIVNFFGAGYLDQAGELTQMQPTVASLVNEAFENVNIVLRSGGANPTGAGGAIIVSVEYWPLNSGPMSSWRG